MNGIIHNGMSVNFSCDKKDTLRFFDGNGDFSVFYDLDIEEFFVTNESGEQFFLDEGDVEIIQQILKRKIIKMFEDKEASTDDLQFYLTIMIEL